MNWKPQSNGPGEYVIAFENMANGMRGFRHIDITEDGDWVEPSGNDDKQLVYMGGHIHVVGYAKLSFPRKRTPHPSQPEGEAES